MVTNMVISLAVLVYGVNFLVYMYLKISHIEDYLEKTTTYLGTNMTLLSASGIFLFLGKIVKDGILVFEQAEFLQKASYLSYTVTIANSKWSIERSSAMKEIYETAMINHGGRNGGVEAPNGLTHMKITPPGIHAEGISPEQLFAAGYASCSNGTVQRMIKEARMAAESTVKTRVPLYNLDGGGCQIGVVLEVRIDDISGKEAQKITEDVYGLCPYSKTTRGNIGVEVTTV